MGKCRSAAASCASRGAFPDRSGRPTSLGGSYRLRWSGFWGLAGVFIEPTEAQTFIRGAEDWQIAPVVGYLEDVCVFLKVSTPFQVPR